MYCFISGQNIPICNDPNCPVHPCNDKRAIEFLRESTDLSLRQAKKQHRNFLKGVLSKKIVFNIPEYLVSINYKDFKWYIEIKQIHNAKV